MTTSALPLPPSSVSRETADRLALYETLLKKWQGAVNLVSPATVPEARIRHFEDSAQLAGLIPAGAKTLLDLGSGAGFPGLVLALIRPDLSVHLIESDSKKCSFLKTVSRETGAGAAVHNTRIESLSGLADLPVPDVITARALSSLDALLDHCLPFFEKNQSLIAIFPKGAQAAAEVAAATESYLFDIKEYSSRTDNEGTVLVISNLRKK